MSIKDKIRFGIFPHIALLLNKIGVKWNNIGNTIIGRLSLIAQIQKIIENSNESLIPKSNQRQNFIFFTMLGGHAYNTSIECCLAKILQLRGHNVKLVIDDGFLPISQEITTGSENRWNEISQRNKIFAKMITKAWKLKTIPLSTLVRKKRLSNNIQEYNDILEASLLRHYKVGVLSKKLPKMSEVCRRYKDAIFISEIAAERILEYNPDAIIMSHGIYSTWGPAYRIFRKNNTPVLTYGRGKKAGTSKFNWNCTSDWWDVDLEWKELKNRQLNSKEISSINEYLLSRISHKNDVFVYNFGHFERKEQTLIRFNLNPQKTTYSLFTNVLWDAASAQREIAFRNPIDWVIETIEWFRSKPDIQLIVKIHPAEMVIGTNMPFKEIIDKHIENIPSNVRIIEPQEKVNSWSIYGVTDLGIVHTTTVGMELPLEGIPCVVVSKTHFRNKGFTIDINSKEDYFKTLRDFDKENVDKVKIKDLSKRYAYLLFQKYQMPLDLFYEKTTTDVRAYRFSNLKELYEKPTIKIVVNAIENRITSILNHD